MCYYKVDAKCGHVGRNYYVVKSFPIIANTKKEAAKIVRGIPRVKHHHKDAIKAIKEITLNEYISLGLQHASDPYFHCKNIQLQRKLCHEEIFEEPQAYKVKQEKSRKKYYYGKTSVKFPKRFDKYVFHT